MGAEDNVLTRHFQVFLGYHGTEDPNGSLAEAEKLYDILTYKNKVEAFIQTRFNIKGGYKDTPIVASHSDILLFVANGNVAVNADGTVAGADIREELKRFYETRVYGEQGGLPRVFACGGLTHERASRLHIMFSGVADFRAAEKGEAGFMAATLSLLKWLAEVLGRPEDYFDDTIVHFFGEDALPKGRRRSAKKIAPGIPLGEQEAVKRALEYSAHEFFHKHATARLHDSPEKIWSDITEFSRIFKDITQAERFGDPRREDVGNIGSTICEIITEGLRSGSSDADKLILKIKSPLGSYKNRLLQYVYLYLAKTLKGVLPFFIDVAMYEKTDRSRWPDGTIEERLRRNMADIAEMVKASPDLKPLVMVDGIRDFAGGKIEICDKLKDHLDDLGCYWVVGVDTDFTNNSKHRIYNRIAPDNFRYFIRISSMKLDRKKESKEFMKACIEIFRREARDIGNYSADDVDQLYEKFNKFELISLDAYWFITILGNLSRYSPENLIELYASLCKDVLGNRSEDTDSAARFAYNFEFGRDSFEDSDFFFSKEWKTVRKHRSTLDFLVARYYMKRLEELDMNKLAELSASSDKAGLSRELEFFDIVMPKSITRFIVAMLRQSDEMQNKVLEIAEKYYYSLGLYGKSEFTLWLGRLTSKYSRRAQLILEDLRRDQLETCENCAGADKDERRNNAFLLRGISVSRIYGGSAEAFTDYMHSLLHDKLANDINRGFHLEYYGDIKFSGKPGNYVLELTDDISKGINTLRVLEMSLSDLEKSANNSYTYKTTLQLFTMCSLIQARMCGGNNVLDVSGAVPLCLDHINVLLSQRVFFNRLDGEIKAYFRWIADEFSSFERRRATAIETGVYGTFSRAGEVKRTGWVNRGLHAPENIVEHMYNCWLMGLIFLPDHSEEEGYCKDSILKMLLIHDIGETVTGDIDRGTKNLNRDKYDKREDEVVRSLLFIGTYPAVNASLSDFSEQWTHWLKHNEDDAGINALIAKDIDDIQAAYQYCVYYLSGEGKFTDEDCARWLSEIYVGGPCCALRTNIGRMISKKAIIENPAFAKCIQLLR